MLEGCDPAAILHELPTGYGRAEHKTNLAMEVGLVGSTCTSVPGQWVTHEIPRVGLLAYTCACACLGLDM